MPKKIDPAVRERAVRLVREHRAEYSSLTAAAAAVARQEWLGTETVRRWAVQSGQYTAIRYADRLADAGALASIGSVADSYDSAMAESVIGLYKTECVRHDGPFRSVDDLELATLSWVHWFNADRLHSSIDYQTPIEHETAYYRQNNPRQQPLPGEPILY